jgi:hypothetical protein
MIAFPQSTGQHTNRNICIYRLYYDYTMYIRGLFYNLAPLSVHLFFGLHISAVTLSYMYADEGASGGLV